jgi:molybdopterin molybdotransferase
VKSIGEAQREMVPCFAPLGGERVALLQALDRVLTDPIHAGRDLPPFDNSAMDGYAVRHADLQPGRTLVVHGESRAGGPPPDPLPAGAAMRIFTGAPLPPGADTVVIQETAQRADGSVSFTSLPAPAANVRACGSDLRAGSLALAAGTAVGPGEIALLAALGRHAVSVYRAPRVAILSVGDELRDIGHDHEPGTIVNSNAYALAAQVSALGAEPWVLPIVPDQLDAIAAVLEQALRADVVLSAGGVSVGEYDLMAAAFERAGVRARFAKIAIKPGKPLWFGQHGSVPVVGLPGNPVSALVTFELFVRPALRHMLGHTAPYPSPIEVRLEHAYRHATGRVELARASLTGAAHEGDSRPLARLHALQGSGSLPSMVAVDALVVLDANVESFAAGAIVPALPLRTPGYQRAPAFA